MVAKKIMLPVALLSIFVVLIVSHSLMHEIPFATNGILQEHYDHYRIVRHTSYEELIHSFFTLRTEKISDPSITDFEAHRLFQISWRPVFFLYYKGMYDLFGLDNSIPALIRYFQFIFLVLVIYGLLYARTQKVWLAFLCAMLYFFSPPRWTEDFWLVSVRSTIAMVVIVS